MLGYALTQGVSFFYCVLLSILSDAHASMPLSFARWALVIYPLHPLYSFSLSCYLYLPDVRVPSEGVFRRGLLTPRSDHYSPSPVTSIVEGYPALSYKAEADDG
ncbi:hypothetical protein F5146DRAFT_1023465 [Armillaria mellea]|nr:hypothetical protein F5146DRAFT_1023465 [Armillaria mellea]